MGIITMDIKIDDYDYLKYLKMWLSKYSVLLVIIKVVIKREI